MPARTAETVPRPARRHGLDRVSPAHRPHRHPAERGAGRSAPGSSASGCGDSRSPPSSPARCERASQDVRAGRLRGGRDGRSRPGRVGLRPLRGPDHGRDLAGAARLVAVPRRLPRRRVGRGRRRPGRPRHRPAAGIEEAASSVFGHGHFFRVSGRRVAGPAGRMRPGLSMLRHRMRPARHSPEDFAIPICCRTGPEVLECLRDHHRRWKANQEATS